MAAITAALIKQVREETGAGMMDVKKALTEAEGDVARAKEIIRAKGIQAAGKREGRKAQEGTIASTVVESANGQTGYAVDVLRSFTRRGRPCGGFGFARSDRIARGDGFRSRPDEDRDPCTTRCADDQFRNSGTAIRG